MQYSPVHKAIASILCVSFALGILLQYHTQWPMVVILIVGLSSFGLLTVFQFLKTTKYSLLNLLQLLIVILLSATLGSYRLQQEFQPPTYENLPSKTYIGTLLNYPDEREKSYKVEIQIDSFYHLQNSCACNIRLMAYFEKNESLKAIRPGQVIRFEAELQAPPQASNPEGFDYRQYLAFKQIYASSYITQDRWQLTPHYHPSLKIRASHLQHYIVNQLQTLPFGDEELAVLSALTVGYKQFIDQDQREAYATSGVSHVLSVSGLHTGILFVFLSRFFFMFGQRKWGRWFKTLIIIILLWCFAFITGLSPSVCRATLMFSCISIGIAQRRQSNIFNMVFISAFILLIINPLNLFALGFQLSYLAVLGILTFQPIFQNLFYERWHIYKPISELLSVSIAAQIGTLPIAIHTFNTFPLYFLLTNIWIIPLVACLLNLAIVLIIFCLTHIPCVFFAKVLNLLILVMNKGVLLISQLPYAQVKNIYLSEYQAIFLYLALFSFAIAWLYHSKVILKVSLFSTVLVCSLLMVNHWDIKEEHKLFAFYHNKHFNLCVQNGNQAIMLADSIHDLPDYYIHHHLKGDALSSYSFAETFSHQLIQREGDFFLTGNQITALYSDKLEKHTKPLSIHTLFIDKTHPKSLYKLYQTLHFQHLVLFKKPKNYYYYRNFCEKNNVHLHLIQRDGAYSSSLSVGPKALACSN